MVLEPLLPGGGPPSRAPSSWMEAAENGPISPSAPVTGRSLANPSSAPPGLGQGDQLKMTRGFRLRFPLLGKTLQEAEPAESLATPRPPDRRPPAHGGRSPRLLAKAPWSPLSSQQHGSGDTHRPGVQTAPASGSTCPPAGRHLTCPPLWGNARGDPGGCPRRTPKSNERRGGRLRQIGDRDPRWEALGCAGALGAGQGLPGGPQAWPPCRSFLLVLCGRPARASRV